MSELAERLIADLRNFSGELLEAAAGAARRRPATGLQHGTESVLLGATRALTGLVPHLLDELEDVEDPRNVIERPTWTATRARLSHAQRDWVRAGAALLPQRWVRTEPAPEPDLAALGWLIHLVGRLGAELETVSRRTERYVEEARVARRGTSIWAARDLAGLEMLERRLASARIALERASRSIALRAEGRALASARSPSPFPRGRAWWRLRELAADIQDKQRTLAQRIAALLGVAPELADEPVLYQRWCGMRLLEGLAGLGWSAEGDYVGALYLAGHVALQKHEARIDLWIENRLTREAHSSGFLCVRGADATPDYLIVTPGAGGLDAFVLDATLSNDEDVLSGKRRYLELLEGVAPAMAAGVISGPRRPLRSWAAAPLDIGHCRLSTQSGSVGIVPMQPLHWNPDPLRAWLSDVERHARAWS